MTESLLYYRLFWSIVFFGPLATLYVLFIPAKYGRYADESWWPRIPARLAWVLMESPASLVFAGVYFWGENAWKPFPLALFCIWQLHYVDRSFIFPFKMRLEGKRDPINVMFMGIFFNTINGYLNGRYLTHFGNPASAWALVSPTFLIGVALFGGGFYINRWADKVLRNLRKPGEKGYKIPKGGLYEYVACPNYLGELLEWLGFAVASSSPAAWAFLLFTFCNLAPRAVTHLKWYRSKFPEYPKERKALIPLIL